MDHAASNTINVSHEPLKQTISQTDMNRVRTMSTVEEPSGVTVINQDVREQIARALRLHELLQQITPENSHDEEFSEAPIGKEEW